MLITSLTLLAGGCKKSDSNNDDDDNGGGGVGLTDRQKLTSKPWSSYKIFNGGNDVTASSSTITFTYNDNGNFTATGNSGSGTGVWSLSGKLLDMGNEGKWNIINLTTSDLKLDFTQGDIQIYLN